MHAAPDVTARRADDTDTALAYAAAGYAGFVLKAHYESTVGRAHAAARASGIAVHGGVALNQHVGGVNPAAVAAALGAGGRIVWLPTADAHTQQAAGLPRLCHDQPRIGTQTFAIPPVDPTAEPALRTILALVAEADAVLATGHVSTAEAAWVVDAARAAGVRRLLLTHPSYTVPAMSGAEARALDAPSRSRRTSCCTSPIATRHGSRRSSARSATSGSSCPPTPASPTRRRRRKPSRCWSTRWPQPGLIAAH